jgi:hypothetical protein
VSSALRFPALVLLQPINLPSSQIAFQRTTLHRFSPFAMAKISFLYQLRVIFCAFRLSGFQSPFLKPHNRSSCVSTCRLVARFRRLPNFSVV